MSSPLTREQVVAAVKQLRGSERGRQALADLKRFLDHGGDALDTENQLATLRVLLGAFTSFSGTVHEMLEE